MATRTMASRSEKQAALMALFRQQEMALAAEHARQRSALMMVMEEPLAEPSASECEFERGVTAETVASATDLAVQTEEHVDCQDAIHIIPHDVNQGRGDTSCEFNDDGGTNTPAVLHAVYDESELVDPGYSAAREAPIESGVCEAPAREREAGVTRCDQLTSEWHRADCIHPRAGGQVGGCGMPDSASHASDGGGRSSPCLSSGSRSDSEARGRKRRSPDDGLVFDDDSIEDVESSASPPHQATWAATLTQVEKELAINGLSDAATLAVESIGCEFQEAPPQLTGHGWVSMARIVREDTHEVLFKAAGKHAESKRTARRSAYCQVLLYAATQIAANMVKAFRPSSVHGGLRLEDLHHHLHDRIKDLLERAALGRTAYVATDEESSWPIDTGYLHGSHASDDDESV